MCLPAEIKQLMESSSLENYGYQIIHMCLLSLSLSLFSSPDRVYLSIYRYVYKFTPLVLSRNPK
jgi:hypothetical protein